MKTNKKILALLNHGFKESTLTKLNENQIGVLYDKLMEQGSPTATKKSETKTVDTYTLQTGSSMALPPNVKGKNVTIKNMGNTTQVIADDVELDEELNEKSVSKKQQEFFGVVRGMQKGKIPMKGKAGKAAKEMSKKDVKDFASTKHKGLPTRKETKENYMDMIGKAMNKNMLVNGVNKMKPGVNWSDSLKEKVEEMVDKHITPKISKKDFINYVLENNTKEAPEKKRTKEREKEKTPTKKPDTPYKPKPGPEKAPKAKKRETKEDTKTAPSKPVPTIKPGTKPTTKPRPDTPYRPKPGPEKAPKAKRGNMPEWMSFSSIGINLK